MDKLKELEQRVDSLEKKIAELAEKVQLEKFIPEDSDGIRGFGESIPIPCSS